MYSVICVWFGCPEVVLNNGQSVFSYDKALNVIGKMVKLTKDVDMYYIVKLERV